MMDARRVGTPWFDSDKTFNDFINKPHGYYSIDGAADIDVGEIQCNSYQSEPDPISGQTVTLYHGSVNPIIPAGAEGVNVVYKIYDPVNVNDKLEYPAINVYTAQVIQLESDIDFLNVSQYIDAGENVEFVNEPLINENASVSLIHLSSDGIICIWGAHETIFEAKTLTLKGGNIHTIPGIHGIRADDTGSSIGIKVKI